MATTKKLMGTTAVGGFTAIEDVFSTYLYNGTSTSVSHQIQNGIDLAGEGGLVWIKKRDSNISDTNHYLSDTERGNYYIASNSINPQAVGDIASYNSDGWTFNASTGLATDYLEAQSYASWTFRKAPRFFDVVTYTGDGTTDRTIPHNLELRPGFIAIKRTDATSNWYCAARINDSTAAVKNEVLGKNFGFNSTTAADLGSWATIADDTTFNLNMGGLASASTTTTNINGATYVAYLFAHDPLGESGDGSDGLIACGSYTGSGGSGVNIDLGWEAQWVMLKKTSDVSDWKMMDAMRGTPNPNGGNSLLANSSNDEATDSTIRSESTGFSIYPGSTFDISGDYIYIAIRRGPMRQPTSGTEVFSMDTYGATAPNPPALDAGWPVDMGFWRDVDASGPRWSWIDRMRGTYRMFSDGTDAEVIVTSATMDYQTGMINSTSVDATVHGWMFRRAPGFFDAVAYTGTGTKFSQAHALGVTPQLIITKRRDGAGSWLVYTEATGLNNYLLLNTSDAVGSASNYSAVSDTHYDTPFASTGTYISYLFATLPGISKVGSYTGNGTNQTIDCGFTSGARFVLIKRTDGTGNWYLFDSARGIVSGNDPVLQLNSTGAEEADYDDIDPVSSGFIINQTPNVLNTTGASYIYLAIA